ncbi:MAG TPA: glycosyltransferase [Dissulfurispiraceae bacterium]
MIKISLVIDTILSPTGGTEKHLLSLLSGLDRKIFQPYLCILRPSEWLMKGFDLCPVYAVNLYSFKYLHSYYCIWKLADFLRRTGTDIVHTYHRDANMAGIMAARIAGKKIVASRRNQGYWLNRRELLMQKFFNRWVELFISNSYSTKIWSTEAERIPAEKIRVIYNGVDLEPYKRISRETRKRYRRKLGIPDDAPVIGIVANLRPVKGIDVFLHAARLIRDELPAARFVVVGDGEEEHSLKGLSRSLALEDSVSFLGRRKDVVSILGMFDVAVLSSRSESFSNSLVEYMAAGLPVVCTDVGGCREAIEDGVNGFVLPVEDYGGIAEHTVRIIKGELFYFMGMRNRDKAEKKFSMAGCIKAYEKIYQRVANSGAAGLSRRVAVAESKAD